MNNRPAKAQLPTPFQRKKMPFQRLPTAFQRWVLRLPTLFQRLPTPLFQHPPYTPRALETLSGGAWTPPRGSNTPRGKCRSARSGTLLNIDRQNFRRHPMTDLLDRLNGLARILDLKRAELEWLDRNAPDDDGAFFRTFEAHEATAEEIAAFPTASTDLLERKAIIALEAMHYELGRNPSQSPPASFRLARVVIVDLANQLHIQKRGPAALLARTTPSKADA